MFEIFLEELPKLLPFIGLLLFFLGVEVGQKL